MKFSISGKKIGSIVLLLLVIFISLALSDIPYIARFRSQQIQPTQTIEGFPDSTMEKIKTELNSNDTYFDKVEAIHKALKTVENTEDEVYVKFMEIINKKNYPASDKVADMKNLISAK